MKSQGGDPMPDSEAKRSWTAENTICVNLRINRNQDPELYQLLTTADNKSAVIRDLIKKALTQDK
jgi:hypothetical protein